ncbi:MAG: CsgG/HfaB family protein [bacterium]
MFYHKQKIHFKLLTFLLIVSLFNLTGCAGTKPYCVSNFFIDDSIHELRQKRVAVLPFDNLTQIEEATLLITDEFNLQLGKIGKFELVERIRIEELFKEQDFRKDRIDETTAVKIGKMLGAHAVVLGVITKYVPYERDKQVAQSQQPTPPPIVIEDHPYHKDKDEDKNSWDLLDTIIFVTAVVSVVGIIYILFLQPSTEVGVSVRMINVETGQHLWQAKDTFKGNRASLKTLVKTREERKRLRKDIDFLTQQLCQKLAETLK